MKKTIALAALLAAITLLSGCQTWREWAARQDAAARKAVESDM